MNHTPHAFLGIDGGGTKTTAVLCSAQGEVIARAEAGSLNYRALGYDTARASLRDVLSQLPCEPSAAFIGNAALADQAPLEELHALTHGILNHIPVGMNSDLYIALEAMQCAGASAVIIAGTGSMCAGRTAPGEPIVHTGGWGWLLGDEGSGFHLGWEGLRAALRGYEGSAPATQLTAHACEFYDAKQPEELLNTFYNPNKRHNEIAAFARVVSGLDDAVAQAIVQRCAADLAQTAKALLRKLPANTQIGLWGGLFERRETYRQAFCAALGKQAQVLPVPPAQGAAMAAMRLAACGGA
ncbi:MAG: hypothetical protein FWB76_04000 [Oscillospiraceae bacterium]|nr:hypothetical protein [Oscillospiraceae bacterium]